MNRKFLRLLAVSAMAASFSAHADTLQWDFTSGLMTGTSETYDYGVFPLGPCSGYGSCGVTPTSGTINGVVDVTNGSVTNFDISFNGVNYGTNQFSYGNIGGGVTGAGFTTEITTIPNLSLFTPSAPGPGAAYGLTGYIDMSSGAPLINLSVGPGGAEGLGATFFDLVINPNGTQFSLGYSDVEPGAGCSGYSGPLITTTSGTPLNPCSMQLSSASAGTWKAPELDPTSAASGFTLLLGCLLVLRGRRARVPF